MFAVKWYMNYSIVLNNGLRWVIYGHKHNQFTFVMNVKYGVFVIVDFCFAFSKAFYLLYLKSSNVCTIQGQSFFTSRCFCV